jgi:hypothetical protein
MLGWIPLLGPIFSGISSIFGFLSNTEIAKVQAQTQTTIAETQASVSIIQATEDDIGIRIMRDMVCLPVVVWSMLIGWDTIIADRWPDWMFHVEKYPDSVSYLPYAVLIFLLGNIGINAWKQR